ncbi:AsmA-like C-terminal region-containing protein, partial [Pirellulales bacterium]|nr:AsmA-like C-terminal region-containing protein [Pirellulales bacterium]
ITEMQPRGTFNVFWRLDRKTVGGPPQTHLQLQLVDISINYDRFPYPLRGVRGLIQAENRHWTFRQLESGGRRSVQCEGRLVPTPDGNRLELTFSGRRVTLDDDLFGAVSPQVQRAWTELRAKGHVDFTARVSHLEGEASPGIWASIRPLPESASIQPKFFDYEMDDLSGEVTYEDGALELIRLKASHDDTQLAANGHGHFAPGGGWQVQLTGLTVDRLRPARDLLAALPPKMAITIDSLQPRGSFSIYNGVLDFRQPLSPTAPIESQWDVQLDCHQADVHCGVELKNIHGTVRLRGGDDGKQSFSTGELELETAVFQDVQFTNIRGPFWVNETQCRFGRWANRGEAGPPRRLTAEVFGGSFAADGGVDFRELPHYRIEASVVDADLVRMITERFGDESEVTGKADANVVVEGKGRLVDGMIGTGDVHVHDADIYESPMLLRLLKTLRYGKRDATAFNEVNATFRMEGRHVYLSQLDFLGDVVNLYGEGYTNFDHDLKLRFHGQVGRNKYLLPVVKHVVGEVNRQIVEVYVDGTLSNPQVHTKALPGFSQLLGGWQNGQPGPSSHNPRQALFPVPSAKTSPR